MVEEINKSDFNSHHLMSIISDLGNVLRSVKNLVNDAIIIAKRTRWSMIRFANNEPTIINNWVSAETTIYVTKSRKYLTSTISTVKISDINNEIQNLVKRLDTVPQEDEFYVQLTHVGEVRRLQGSYDSRVEGDIDVFIDKLNDAIQASLNEGSQRNAGALTFGVEEKYYVDTTGLELEDKSSFVALTIRAFLNDVTATSVSISRGLDGFKPKDAGSEAGILVSMAKDLPEEKIENGRYDVILGPLIAGHLYGLVVSSWFNAYSIITESSGISRDDIGKLVASDKLTIEDMSSEGSFVGSESFDYEGNPTRSLEVLGKGVLTNVLHNNRTAAKFNTVSTGHAVDDWLRPSPRHVRISVGNLPDNVDGLIAELGNGLLLTNNWYTRFQNIREGLFSTVIRDVALLVRGGKPVAKLRGLRIADSFRTLLRNFVDSSKSARQVHWWDMPIPATSPYVLIKGLGITKG